MMARRSWKSRMQGIMFRMPMMITCRQFEEFIIEYLEGGLTDHQRRLFEIHLKVCRECREYLAAYKTSLEAAKRSFPDDATSLPDEVPEDLVAAVVASRGAIEK